MKRLTLWQNLNAIFGSLNQAPTAISIFSSSPHNILVSQVSLILRLTHRLFVPAVIARFVVGIKSVYERRLLLRSKKRGGYQRLTGGTEGACRHAQKKVCQFVKVEGGVARFTMIQPGPVTRYFSTRRLCR